MQLLLARNADVNKRSKQGRTALLYAVWEGNKEIARMLLEIGHADVNQPTEDGNTPLMVAAWDNQRAIVDLLLDHHAEVFGWVNKNGDYVVKIALEHGHQELAQYLFDVGLKRQGGEKEREKEEGETHPGGFLDFDF